MEIPALAQALSEIFETSLAIEPAGGSNPAWAAMLQRYGVTPLAEHPRFDEAKQLGLTRGAPLSEVERCVVQAIAAFTVDAGPTQRAVAEAIWTNGKDAYLGYARYRPRGMFAHAIATAHARKGEWARPPGGYVHQCTGCGGPRLHESLACGFCGTAWQGEVR